MVRDGVYIYPKFRAKFRGVGEALDGLDTVCPDGRGPLLEGRLKEGRHRLVLVVVVLDIRAETDDAAAEGYKAATWVLRYLEKARSQPREFF